MVTSAVARELERRASKLFSGVEVHILSDQEVTKGALMGATGRAIIAPSGKGQMALEGYRGHGVFTYAVLDGLRGAADLRGNRNRQIELEELASYVREVVPRLTREQWNYEQFPMINLQGMDFPLGLLDE